MKQNRSRTAALLGMVTMLASFAVYLSSVPGEFIWDDVHQIVRNPLIRDLRNIPSFFTSDLWKLIDNPAVSSYYYRPFFLLSLAVDYSLWGLNPIGYHLTNLILHAIASFLVYQVSLKIIGHQLPALFAGVLFAIHPIHGESVACISGRNDPLAAVFFLLSFYLYVLYAERRRIFILVLSLVAYSSSLLSKEIGITLPLLLLAYELSFKPAADAELRRMRSLRVIGLYLLVSAAYLFARVAILGQAIGTFPSAAPPLDQRMYTSVGIILEYLRIMVLPMNLKVFYDIPLKESLFDWKVLAAAALLGAVLAVTVLTYRVGRSWFFASLWFFITIIPVSGLVLLRPTMMAERHVYLPSVGLCMLAGLAFYKACRVRPLWSPYLKVMALVLLVVLSLITFRRNGLWKNELVYFTRMTEDAPQSTYAHYNLGAIYREKGDMSRAISEWEKTITLDPHHSEANNNLGNVAMLEGNYSEGVSRYRLALQGNPDNVESHYNLALALEKLGRTDEAVLHYREFIARAPVRYESMIDEAKAHIQSLKAGDQPH